MPREKKILCWHFVRDDRRLRNAGGMNLEVSAGFTYSVDGEVQLCRNGLHASRDLSDALFYGYLLGCTKNLCLVEVWGDVSECGDKIVGRHRAVLSLRRIDFKLPNATILADPPSHIRFKQKIYKKFGVAEKKGRLCLLP